MVQMIFSAPGEQPLPAVAWNYEEVKAEVEASLAQYKDRAYTPETIGGAKADRAALNKLADVLAAKRREVKAQYLAPYENFERQIVSGLELNTFISGPANTRHSTVPPAMMVPVMARVRL